MKGKLNSNRTKVNWESSKSMNLTLYPYKV